MRSRRAPPPVFPASPRLSGEGRNPESAWRKERCLWQALLDSGFRRNGRGIGFRTFRRHRRWETTYCISRMRSRRAPPSVFPVSPRLSGEGRNPENACQWLRSLSHTIPGFRLSPEWAGHRFPDFSPASPLGDNILHFPDAFSPGAALRLSRIPPSFRRRPESRKRLPVVAFLVPYHSRIPAFAGMGGAPSGGVPSPPDPQD